MALAAVPLGSVVLAKKRLTEWLAAGEVPWSCMSWKGLDAEGIADKKRRNSEGVVFFVDIVSVAYHPGDPQFWRAGLNIDWEDNGARERGTYGAQALGIKVSRAHLIALLPEDPHKNEQVRGAGVWIAAEVKRMKEAGDIPDGIGITEFSRELARRMKKAAATDHRPIKARSIENGLRAWGLWPITRIK